MPKSVKEIGLYAFDNCGYLKAVYIPEGVAIINSHVFSGYPNLTIYCEGEHAEGWVNEKPEYRTETVTTPEDYVFDFHRGGVSRSEVTVEVINNWNPDGRTVKTCVPYEKFLKLINKENG